MSEPTTEIAVDTLIPPRISPSQIRTLNECPRAYAYKYCMSLKPSNADAEYFIIGRAFHDCAQGKAAPELVDLRPLDESKKDYRAMLRGMLDELKKNMDLENLVGCETPIKTDSETLKIDGLYVEGSRWYLCEIKTPSGRGFNIEEKKQLLKRDLQLAAYVARKKLIADTLMLDAKDFAGIKYVFCLKPTTNKDPKYICHVVDLTEQDLQDPMQNWITHKAYAKLIQDVIRRTFLQRKDPLDVPCNVQSCRTLTGHCGFYEQCYGKTPAIVGAEEQGAS